jgi:hypothetical protein
MARDSEWKDIKLSAKVFGHLSQGLYRTPAGAIKELISNAFDADSPSVKIHTGFPRFDSFSCEDSGSGISRTEFDRLMDMGIGTSLKRTHASGTTPSGRRMIGRLGIGLLSIAQICTEFDLISHHAQSQQAFKVTIRFPPYTKEEIDKLTKRSKNAVIRGGQFRVTSLEFDSSALGVKIYTKHLRQSFRKRMRNLDRYGNLRKFKSKGPYSSFDCYMKAMYEDPTKVQSLSFTSDYDQLLFGLALAPPLPYYNGDNNAMLQIPTFEDYQARLLANEFEVTVDNLQLKHPIKLPSTREKTLARDCEITRSETRTFQLVDGPHEEKIDIDRFEFQVKDSDVKFSGYPISYHNKNVGGRPLKFSGYLFQQTSRLYPREIQGVLVRIRDIAIGSYDPGFMNYPFQEGPRFSMVSCELIAEEGFEDALNIDRDSFNGLDSHYLRMQAYVYALLHSVIFPETWKEEKKRNKARRSSQKGTRRQAFLRSLRALDGTYSRIERVAANESDRPVQFIPDNKRIIINVNNPLIQRIMKRRKYEDLAEELAVVFEKVASERSMSKQRELFYTLLGNVLDNQP